MSKNSTEKTRHNKTSTTFSLLLILAILGTLIALPAANAHTPPWTLPTHAFLSVSPNPVGIGERVIIVAWVDWPLPETGLSNDIRFRDYKVVITRPDGQTETINMPSTDPTSTAYTFYTPTQIGTYSFVFSHPGIVYTWNTTAAMRTWTNDTFQGATSKTLNLTVQEEQIPKLPQYPLPTEYWTRPIEGQNTDWWKISSNWLGRNSGQILGGGNWGGGGIQPDGTAPNSPHIMWAKPLEAGGVVGGTYSFAQGVTFYTGLSYEGRFGNPLIVNGRLYYDTPLGNNANSGPYKAVDLRTGETVWQNPDISPSFGQLYMYDTPNQHGVIPSGMLWQISGTTWMAYDPLSGQWLFNQTNVPSGTTVYGPNGEILRYQLNYGGRWLALWNNTAAPGLSAGTQDQYNLWQWRPIGKNVNASTAYSWNVTIPNLPGLANPSILSVIPDDLILGTSTNFAAFTSFLTPNPYTFWAISLKPGTRGQLLWIKNYTAPAGNLTLSFLGAPNAANLNLPVDPVNRVFFVTVKETSQWYGYDLDNGDILWGPAGEFRATQYFGTTSNPPAIGYPAYGKLYVAGYGGILYAFDARNGSLLWTYGNGGTGNSTYSGVETPWGYYPIFVSTIADGKIYLFSGEHSPNVPPYKGSRIRAIDATTGKELWTILGWHASGGFGQWAGPTADGYLIFYNVYDARIYAVGKGSSAMTIEAPKAAITQGSSLVISGTVTDISPGTKQEEQAARFPNGVPAVSDESISAWMEYVYMQKPRPTDAKGVEVTLNVLDSNNNFREIGKTTTDTNGFYSYLWKPDIPGKYTVYASFAGSESYWPSHAETAFGVDPAPPAPAEPEPEPPTVADTYLLPGVGGIIATIVIVGGVIVLALRKRP